MKDPIITETRKSNLERAFNWIKWDWSSAEITIKGWGDRPQFTIKGKYKGFSFLYRSQSLGGGPSSLKWFDKKGNHPILPICGSSWKPFSQCIN